VSLNWSVDPLIALAHMHTSRPIELVAHSRNPKNAENRSVFCLCLQIARTWEGGGRKPGPSRSDALLHLLHEDQSKQTRVSVVSKNLVWLTNYVLSEVCNKKGRETKRERESERDQKNKRTIPKDLKLKNDTDAMKKGSYKSRRATCLSCREH
jgi:hypothetical protein